MNNLFFMSGICMLFEELMNNYFEYRNYFIFNLSNLCKCYYK